MFQGPCSLIKHDKINGKKHGVVFKIEIPHNQLNGRHMVIPNPEFFVDSDPIELAETINE